jgi:hypothetical protein
MDILRKQSQMDIRVITNTQKYECSINVFVLSKVIGQLTMLKQYMVLLA